MTTPPTARVDIELPNCFLTRYFQFIFLIRWAAKRSKRLRVSSTWASTLRETWTGPITRKPWNRRLGQHVPWQLGSPVVSKLATWIVWGLISWLWCQPRFLDRNYVHSALQITSPWFAISLRRPGLCLGVTQVYRVTRLWAYLPSSGATLKDSVHLLRGWTT